MNWWLWILERFFFRETTFVIVLFCLVGFILHSLILKVLALLMRSPIRFPAFDGPWISSLICKYWQQKLWWRKQRTSQGSWFPFVLRVLWPPCFCAILLIDLSSVECRLHPAFELFSLEGSFMTSNWPSFWQNQMFPSYSSRSFLYHMGPVIPSFWKLA